MAAKKKTAVKNPRKKPERIKGGFGVFVQETWYADNVEMDKGDGKPCLVQIALGLKDTQDSTGWIKENAEKYEGKTLIIAQIKQSITCAIEKVVRVKIEEVQP